MEQLCIGQEVTGSRMICRLECGSSAHLWGGVLFWKLFNSIGLSSGFETANESIPALADLKRVGIRKISDIATQNAIPDIPAKRRLPCY